MYCRVSIKKQQESGNLQRQKERLLSYCFDQGYQVVKVFSETASGINENRKELTHMMKRLTEVEKIIIEYPDRLDYLITGQPYQIELIRKNAHYFCRITLEETEPIKTVTLGQGVIGIDTNPTVLL
ncbi:MAG: recombinase family protein [Syntrophomonas sp.]|nr:recombinase family protein [Syntrophomonas sp.]